MCSIFGGLVFNLDTEEKQNKVQRILSIIARKSVARGRDGFGVCKNTHKGSALFTLDLNDDSFYKVSQDSVFIGNCRAEPTTEYVKEKTPDDQQPYQCFNWVSVHNGTIANDKEIRTYKIDTKIDSAAISELLVTYTELSPHSNYAGIFAKAISKLKGSFAILAIDLNNPNVIYGACNYRPIWYIKTDVGIFFGSSRYAFPLGYDPIMIDPYSWFIVDQNGFVIRRIFRNFNNKALVVCSGGLDSVVAATYAQKELGCEIELLHFDYGSRTSTPEYLAVARVANALNAPLTTLPIPIYGKSDSPLLDADSPIAGGEAGAEFAYEWVPARNLVMLSIATAYAEAKGFSMIVLGNNMEEAGAYPDNEPEFIERFNDLLPFAIGANKLIEVVMPVGNLMKHEIVAIGKRLNAPMHLTWSCYRAGQKHCGKCGPCYMRRKAFEINNLPEVIDYEE